MIDTIGRIGFSRSRASPANPQPLPNKRAHVNQINGGRSAIQGKTRSHYP
jgi:hypothetical protein